MTLTGHVAANGEAVMNKSDRLKVILAEKDRPERLAAITAIFIPLAIRIYRNRQ
ncbi:hypothetical protein Dehly_0759 [Dehalogenimonas lykanthroporepellens BL-DC-9]|jgi:hypothetical protein|nr:hypothetical protein Dehly_0759 [Dehalogenimonas lykanthroporepellens BL-DC-9]